MKRTFLVSITCLIFSFSIHAQTIVGEWKLTWLLIENDMAYSIMVPVTLSIEENGKIRGNGGCNTFSGNYSFKKLKKPFKKPEKIKFTNIISTMMACEKINRTESVFFRSLREATTIFINDGELFIESKKIGNTMTLVREEKPRIAPGD
jgi:heat shock protein HslJ